MSGPLKFHRGKVLVDPGDLYCTVLMPAGHVVSITMNRDNAEDGASWIEAYFQDYDVMNITTAIETMTVAEWQKRFGEKQVAKAKRPRKRRRTPSGRYLGPRILKAAGGGE